MRKARRPDGAGQLRSLNEKQRRRLRQLGLRIAYIRKSRGLNQEQLAERIGFSHSYVSKLEANSGAVRHMASLDCLYRIADALDVPISQLFAEDSFD